MKLIKYIKKHILPLSIVLFSLFICTLNYTPDTYLTGWDTLHPELNFPLNFKRLIFGLWRSEQGLGAVAGHSHMADLPRVLILWLLNIFLPTNFLRYAYIFFCFILGPLGIFYLVKFIFNKNKHSQTIALLSSLFYIFNLATIQHFTVPFEMFPTQYAFLPWIILLALSSIHHPTKKNLLVFSLITFFSTPQSYAAHLWYPFFLALSVSLLIYTYFSKTKPKIALTLIGLTLAINSYWLLPNLYFIKTSSHIPQNFKGNQLHSQEFLLRNRQTGNLSDTSINKGFYLNWEIYDFAQTRATSLMPTWNSHLQKLDTKIIGLTLFTASLIGLIYGLKNKHPFAFATLPFFIPSFILLANTTPPFNFLFNLLLKISFLKETLRFIYTKVSIIYQYSLVIYFTLFLKLITSKLKNLKFVTITTVCLLLIYSFPILSPHQLISDKIKVNIPQKYFDTWTFFKNQRQGTILTLPLHNPTGWQYYNWDYQGSGFLWFNLNQSLLDRDFDRWSLQNEQAYFELFNTLYGKNPQNFIKTIQKYNIKYILWDESLISTQAKNISQIIFKYEIKQILDTLVNENLIQSLTAFDNIHIYQINQNQPLITLANIQNDIGPIYQKSTKDMAYFQNGTYQTSSKPDTIYPLRNLLLQNETIDPQVLDISYQNNLWTINLPPQPNLSIQPNQDIIAVDTYFNSQDQSITLAPYLPKSYQSVTLKLPPNQNTLSINNTSSNLSSADQDGFIGISFIKTNSDNFINDQVQKIVFPFQNTTDTTTIQNKGVNFSALDIKNTNPSNLNLSLSSDGKYINFSSLNSTQGTSLKLSSLNHQSAYIIAIKSKYIKGLPLRICLKNNYSFICNIDNQLHTSNQFKWQYFLSPPLDTEIGYELHINAISYANFPSLSQIEQISIIPLPINHLSQPNINQNNLIPQTQFYLVTINKSLPHFHKVSINQANQANTLVFYQAYNSDWLALYFDGLKPVFLKDHVLINNWANGWQFPAELKNQSTNELKIYILFWPQILEFTGLALIPLTFFWFIRRRHQI